MRAGEGATVPESGGLGPLLDEGGPLLLPGAANALTARVIEDLGFRALYLSGAGISNTALGLPDIGLLTMTELADHVAAVADVVSIPIVVDADTGFGNALGVRRAVRTLERAGASAIQLEDQLHPKKCGHFEGKAVIGTDEMLRKIDAALDARRDGRTAIVARTDVRALRGLDEAIERGRAFAEAGADLVFVEAPRTLEELARVAAEVPARHVANMVEGGMTPQVPLAELGAMGFSVVLYANTAMRAAMHAMQTVLTHLRDVGDTTAVLDQMVDWKERQRLVGKPFFDELENRYAIQGAADE